MRVIPSLIRPVALLIVLLYGVASPVVASTITWEFKGTANSGPISEIPAGSSIDVLWTFDPAQPNDCTPKPGNPNPSGVFRNQTLTVTVQSTLGPLTYQAVNGFLVSDEQLPSACDGTVRFDMELRMPFWSGPSLPDATLSPNLLSFPGGLFWQDPTSANGGAFPLVQPGSVLLFSQPFDLPPQPGDTGPRQFALSAQLTAVPEPASVLLVLTGASLIVRRRLLRRS